MATETIQTILVAIVAEEKDQAAAKSAGRFRSWSDLWLPPIRSGAHSNPRRTPSNSALNLRTYSLTPNAKATERTIPNMEDFLTNHVGSWSPSISSRFPHYSESVIRIRGWRMSVAACCISMSTEHPTAE